VHVDADVTLKGKLLNSSSSLSFRLRNSGSLFVCQVRVARQGTCVREGIVHVTGVEARDVSKENRSVTSQKFKFVKLWDWVAY